MAENAFPEDYRDPLYAQLDAANEAKHGLPVGLLSSVRTAGEKSNASATNSLGTKTPYQFIPATRKSILDKYGIDVALSPENASEGAAILLSDSLKRNDGDAATAVREYHGGLDPAKWGPINAAYTNRVMTGVQKAKTDALGSDFAKWLQDNQPATITKAPESKASALDAGFAQYLQAQQQGAGDIPGQTPGSTTIANGDPRLPATTPTSVGDAITGAGEAALNVGTGIVGGTLGMVGGAAGGLAGALATGQFGTPQGADAIEQVAAQGAQALTYQPRTASGQAQAGAVGEALQAALPVMPLTGELQALTRGAAPVVQQIADRTRADVAGAAQLFQQGSDAVAQRLGKAPQQAAQPTPGTMGSVGAAGTDIASQRVERAQDLPVPIRLTKGQASRDFEQQRFEREAAKVPEAGAPIRDRFAEQNQQVQQNIDAFIDQTGAEAPNLRATGVAVDNALNQAATRDKNAIKVAYTEAEKAGEMAGPVDTTPLIDYLNENRTGEKLAPILGGVKDELVRLGGASLAEDGTLVPGNISLNAMENGVRKYINKFVGADPNNIRVGSELKGVIDSSTADVGGPLYQQARALRTRFAQNYGNHAVISDILKTKKGTTDRAVALEDIHKRTILDGSLDDVRQVRRVLQRAGEPGHQAWRELQGQTLNHIKEQALGNSARDVRGNPIVSAAKLDRAIKSLDADGKLDFVFGKKGAQQLRDLNDLAKDIYTAPPGSVNTSNTASVLLAALDMAISGGAGVPLPVMSGIRMIAARIKDRRLAKRINDSLDNANPAVTDAPPQTPRPATIH